MPRVQPHDRSGRIPPLRLTFPVAHTRPYIRKAIEQIREAARRQLLRALCHCYACRIVHAQHGGILRH